LTHFPYYPAALHSEVEDRLSLEGYSPVGIRRSQELGQRRILEM